MKIIVIVKIKSKSKVMGKRENASFWLKVIGAVVSFLAGLIGGQTDVVSNFLNTFM